MFLGDGTCSLSSLPVSSTLVVVWWSEVVVIELGTVNPDVCDDPEIKVS